MCAASLGSPSGAQFTLAAVQAVVVPAGWISSRRTRALIDWLELEHAAARHPPGRDYRERPWSLNGWLIAAVERLTETYLVAASPWRITATGEMPEEKSTVTNMMRGGVSWFLGNAQELPASSEEIRMFLGHAPGFPLLLDLLLAARRGTCGATGCEFSRKATAHAYGVSRAHITALLARAERLNFLKRDGARVVLSDLTFQNVQRDLAYQLAFVVLWLEMTSGPDTPGMAL
ncbi:hypothetical protein O8B93_10050 [Agrobacterium rhizogenes]|uniref:hypothetical protein n=1 Tax=Rhizobium rhizogenes TaxID=359 RepID=UPI0022B734F1|nr:hypothetical protein [Rhizobium rhizogenes]MCZ7447924.1 hypothetical protein [Rhizobium rhizogenes]